MENRKNKKLLTLQDLENFYSIKKKSFHFSASKDTEAIVVQVPGTITFSEDDYDPTLGLLPVHLQSCHIGDNRNKSSISEDSMLQAIPSVYNRPILGYIHKLSDGSYDFAGHEMFINDDGDIEYEEIAVGTIPESCNAQLIEDGEKKKIYLEVDGFIYEEYTRAADILKSKKQSKVSVELSLLDFSYDAKSRHLNIDKFYFSGVTILGVTRDGNETPIEEGMYGSNIKLKDFSVENNSMFSNMDGSEDSKLIEMLEQLNTKIDNLSNFTIQANAETKPEEGRDETVTKFEELLSKYVKTVEDVTFEYENLSDDELEAKFAEVFGEDNADGEGADSEPTSDGDGEGENEPDNDVGDNSDNTDNDDSDNGETDEEPTVTENASVKPKYSITTSDGTVKEFELTLDDITYAIFNLVNDMYAEADNTYYHVSVFESNYVVMHDYFNGRSYKQTFSREGDNFFLTGDRVEVYANWLTKEEEESLNEMRANYASLVQFKADTENAELHAQREAILGNEKYSVLAEKDENDVYKNEAYAKLVSEMDNYSLTDLEKELKSVFADYITNGGQFAYAGEEKSTVTKKLFANSTSKKTGRYGNLFNK